MDSPIAKMPDWSKTVSSRVPASYTGWKDAAIEFVNLSPASRRKAVEDFNERCCRGRMDIANASRLYLLLHVGFDLPSDFPRTRAKIFGGWEHNEDNITDPTFDLAWPVHVNLASHTLRIEPCEGYFGQPYDGLAEYDWLISMFPLRAPELLRSLELTSQQQ